MEAGPGQAIKEEASVQEAKRVAWNGMKWHEMTWIIKCDLHVFWDFLGFRDSSGSVQPKLHSSRGGPVFGCFFCLSWPPGNVAPWRTSMDTEPTWRSTQMSRRCCRLWARWPWVCSLQQLLNWSLSMVPWKCGTNQKRRNKWTNCFQVHTSGGLKLGFGGGGGWWSGGTGRGPSCRQMMLWRVGEAISKTGTRQVP